MTGRRRRAALWWCLWLLILGLPVSPRAEDFDLRPFLHAKPVGSQRVLNGVSAPPHSFPEALQLALRRNGNGASNMRRSVVCGATLIAPGWAITAAHCLVQYDSQGRMLLAIDKHPVKADANQFAVLGGSQRRDDGTPVPVTRLVPHERFLAGETTYDIGLIAFSPPLDGLPLVELLSEALIDQVLVPAKQSSTVVGWGTTAPDREHPVLPEQLQQVDLDILAPPQCDNDPRHGLQFCAGVLDRCTPGHPCTDSCYGDSGGPLYIRYGLSRVQAGIVSHGNGCGLPTAPGIYTSVGRFENWIRQYVPAARFRQPEPGSYGTVSAAIQATVRPPQPDWPGLLPAVSVSVAPAGNIPLGTDVTLRMLSNVAGRLIVFTQDPDGSGSLILPTALSRSTPDGRKHEQIVPGDLVALPQTGLDPFGLSAGPTLGQSRVVALVVPSSTPDLDWLLAPYLSSQRIERLETLTHDLAKGLQPGRVATGAATYNVIAH